MVAGVVSTLAGLGICLFVMLKNEFLPPHFTPGELHVQTIGHTLMGMGKISICTAFRSHQHIVAGLYCGRYNDCT